MASPGRLLRAAALLLFATCTFGAVIQSTVKVGLLHSLTGAMSASEVNVKNAVELAIEEINDDGGIIIYEDGDTFVVTIEGVVKDGESSDSVFAQKIRELYEEEEVVTVFGGWTSSSRKAMQPVLEDVGGTLWYPLQYEGNECSGNIMYFGACPNQQIIPALEWLRKNIHTDDVRVNWYLIGNDYVFPRTANKLIKNYLSATGDHEFVMGEEYIPLSGHDPADIQTIVDDIETTMPNGGIIMNTLNGASNTDFFEDMYTLNQATGNKYTIMSFSVSETEVADVGVDKAEGSYATWNYYETLDNDINTDFLAAFRAKFPNTKTSDPGVSAYNMVKFWALGVQLSLSFDMDDIAAALYGRPLPTPQGLVTLNPNHHTTKAVHIGQVNANGDFDIIHSTLPRVPQPWSPNMYPDAAVDLNTDSWTDTRAWECDWSAEVNDGQFVVESVKVGVLHSTTGPLALSEIPVIEAARMTIEKINSAGGVNDARLIPIYRNGASDPATFVNMTLELIDEDVVAIFGVWASSVRVEVKPVVEEHDMLLFYPVQYEGQECSKNIFYGGALANQQLIPAVNYALNHLGLRYYFVGSNYVFPTTANAILREQITAFGGEVVGEEYIELSDSDVTGMIDNIEAACDASTTPCVIINTLNGDANINFFAAFETKNWSAADYPTISSSIAEAEADVIGWDKLDGHYTFWSYFNSVETDANDAWKAEYVDRYGDVGSAAQTTDPMEASYILINLWAMAAAEAGDFDVGNVRSAMYDLEFEAPEGRVKMTSAHHMIKAGALGQFSSTDSLVDIIWAIEELPPEPWSMWVKNNSQGYTCDWAANETIGGFLPLDQKKVYLIVEDGLVLQSAMYEIDAINREGGLLGKHISPIILDSVDDIDDVLADSDAVATVLDMAGVDHHDFDGNDQLLLYPRQNTGGSCPENTLYGGAVANQLLEQAIEWEFRNRGGTDAIYLLAEDDLADEIAMNLVSTKSGKDYLYVPSDSLPTSDCELFMDSVEDASNILLQSGTVIADVPVALLADCLADFKSRTLDNDWVFISISTSEADLVDIPQADLDGQYFASSYFQALANDVNVAWKAELDTLYPNTVHTVGMSSVSTLIKGWAAGVTSAQSFAASDVRASLYGTYVDTPEGNQKFQENNYATHSFHIAQSLASESELQIVFSSDPLSARPWNYWVNSTNLHYCDHSDADKGEKYVVPTFDVGILHSFQGTMAGAERGVADITRAAIDEINYNGGLLGKQIMYHYRDGESDADKFVTEATAMINDDVVTTIFGLWTSASRVAVVPVIEDNEALLFYPLQYEGQECSKNLFYSGAATNQQLEPALTWALRELAMSWVLIGSDYVYPRTANEVARNYIVSHGGSVEHEGYIPLGSTEVNSQVIMIIAVLPNCGGILNTLNGDSNVAFFEVFQSEFFRMGFDQDEIAACWPVMSMSVGESSIPAIGVDKMRGHYAAWNYFNVLDRPENDAFKTWVASRYSNDYVTEDPMESAYIHVQNWAAAVEKAQSFGLDEVSENMIGLTFEAPHGSVRVEKNHHLSKEFSIGQINDQGLFEIVFNQNRLIYPEPFSNWIDDTRGFLCDWTLTQDEAEDLHDDQYAATYKSYGVIPGFFHPLSVEVGLLHSFTGAMAISEVAVFDTVMAAIDQINAAGGVQKDGGMYRVLTSVKDGASDEFIFADKLQEYLDDDEISVIFGGWTSSSRKQMKLVLEDANNDDKRKLLFYPIQYEGEECSPYIFYTGAVSNQQLVPALQFMMDSDEFSNDFVLVGSDYIFPQTANEIAKAILLQSGYGDVPDHYLDLSATAADVLPLVQQLSEEYPNGASILNSLNGDANVAFFHYMQDYRMTPNRGYLIMSLSVSESEISSIGVDYCVGHYAAWNYFESIDTAESTDFVNLMRSWRGADSRVADPMNSAYEMVNLWKKAAEQGNSFTTEDIAANMYGQEMDAPEGFVTMTNGHHLIKPVRIGKLLEDGTFDILQTTLDVEPQQWNPVKNEGLYGCDHSDSNLGEKYPIDEIRVGIMHSFTGGMAGAEKTVVEAELLAIEEINAAGGLLGKQIFPVLEDGQSTEAGFQAAADILLHADQEINTVFGCWTSASRVAVTQRFLDANKLLYYPLQYEGEECSYNTFYFGSTPNQQLIPAVEYAMRELGDRFYAVGSNYVFPQTANAIMAGHLESVYGIQLLGEEYVELNPDVGVPQIPDIITNIQTAMGDGGIILNTVNGDANVALFEQVYEINEDGRFILMSFSVDDAVAEAMDSAITAGHYAAWSYFHNLGTDAANEFIEKYQEVVGSGAVTADPAEAAYSMVHIWAEAVRKANSFETDDIRAAMYGISFDAPQGTIQVQTNHHVTKRFRVGKINEEGVFDVVYNTDGSIFPEPWSSYMDDQNVLGTGAMGQVWTCDHSQTDGTTDGTKIVEDVYRVGILNSLSGVMGTSERAVADTFKLALQDVNDNGGLLGKKIVFDLRDGRSDADYFANVAQNIVDDEIEIVFGGWTSSSRKAMLPVFEDSTALLFYPLQYEGSECSKSVFYGGATPNVQIVPAMKYMNDVYPGMPWYLVGSDYVFPRTANAIARGYNDAMGASTVGEQYILLNASTADWVLDEMMVVCPDGCLVLNSINGDSNTAFFHDLKTRPGEENFHVMSLSVAEVEVDAIGSEYLEGHYASWNYFEAIDSAVNEDFVSRVRAFLGSDTRVGDPMESAWNLVHLWAQAVATSGTFSGDTLREAMYGQTFEAPEGTVVMSTNHHLDKIARVGKVVDGSLSIVFERTNSLQCEPWSEYIAEDAGHKCDWSMSTRGEKYAYDYVRVGILHSMTGDMSFSERFLVDIELLAIEQINKAGGINGKLIRPVIYDGASDNDEFVEGARYLTNRDDIETVFGCWTSSSRKAVTPVFEDSKKLLFYPLQYEGEECSEQIFYFGQTPNQQLIPAVDYILRFVGSEMYLVGSDYVFPRTANTIITNYALSQGATITGEEYLTLGDTTVEPILEDILDSMPDGGVIFNTLNGGSNVAFFHQMYDTYGMTADMYPTMSASIGESEVHQIGVEYLVGHYACWSYFQTLDRPENHRFVDLVKSTYGNSWVVNDPMESAYNMVMLWSNAYRQARSDRSDLVKMQMIGASMHAPSSVVIMMSSHHLKKHGRVGKLNAAGDFDVVMDSDIPIEPAPWSPYASDDPNAASLWCDHSLVDYEFPEGEDASRFFRNVIKIGIVLSLSGDDVTNTANRDLLLGITTSINIKNLEGGLLGYVVSPVVHDYQNDPAILEEILEELLLDDSIVSLFGNTPADHLEYVYEALGEHNMNKPFFYGDSVALEPSHADLLAYGGSYRDQLAMIFNYYFRREHRTQFFIVGTDNEQDRQLVDIFVDILDAEYGVQTTRDRYYGGKLLLREGVLESCELDLWEDDIREQAPGQDAIKDFCQDDSGDGDTVLPCVVINLLRGSKALASFYSVFADMRQQQVWDRQRLQFLNLFVSPMDIDEIGLNNIVSDYVIGSYFEGIFSHTSNFLIDQVNSRVGVNTVITSNLELGYSMTESWQYAVQATQSFEPLLARMSQYEVSLQAPSGANVLKFDNLMHRNYYLGSVSAQGNIIVNEELTLTSDDADETLQKWITLTDHTVAYFGADEEIQSFNSAVSDIVNITGGINFVLLVIIAAYTLMNRERAAFRTASIAFCITMDFSLLLLTGAGFLFATEPTGSFGTHICRLRVWLMVIGYFFMFSLLLSKIYRIYRVFNNSSNRKLQNLTTFSLITGKVLPFVVLMAGLTIVLQLTGGISSGTQANVGASTQFIVDVKDPICNVDNVFLAIYLLIALVLLLVGIYMAWSSRRISEKYRESTEILSCLFFVIIYASLLLPLNFMIEDMHLLGLLRGLGVNVAVMYINFTIMGNKLMNPDARAEDISSLASGAGGTWGGGDLNKLAAAEKAAT
jgi:urea transport system substrate-binding protein